MRIVIDLQGAQTESRFQAIGRYSLSMAKSIARNRGNHEVLVALNGLFPETIESIRASFDGILPQENIRIWYAPGPVRENQIENKWRREAAERIRESFLAHLQPDVIFVTSIFEGFVDDAVTSIGIFDHKTLVFVALHDMMPLPNSDNHLRKDPDYERYFLGKVESIKRAHGFLAISDSAAMDGIKAFGLETDRVFKTYEACDECFYPIKVPADEIDQLLKKYRISQHFVMYAGEWDPRMNLHRLIRAFARLSHHIRSRYQLVMTGKIMDADRNDLLASALSAGLSEDKLIFTGHVSDDELARLYGHSSLFVFPSCCRVFGLSALEAMACGAPVIVSDSISISNADDCENSIFDPNSEEAIASKIDKALTNEKIREELILHGVQQASRFSWDECARKAIAAFGQIYNERHENAGGASFSDRLPKLAYISPLPPERSGISDYSMQLLPELSLLYDIEVIIAQPEVSDPWVRANLPIRSVEYFMKNADCYDRVVYHFGNSPFHQHMFDLLDRFPGVAVLHDFFLGHVYAYMEHIVPGIWMQELYNSHGYKAMWERFHLSDANEVLFKYPCNLSVIQKSIGLIVHSSYSLGLANIWYGIGGDWHVIPLLRKLSESSNRMDSRRKLGIARGTFLVCSFGILGSVKQNHRLLSSWINSRLSGDQHCQLVFVGEIHGDDYSQTLIETIRSHGLQDRIRITGWVDAEMFQNYLRAADIAVQLRTLSRGETSAAVLDCMNEGIPTIVNANGSLAELPKDAVYLLPDDFHDTELIEALELLWSDPEYCRVLGDKARNFISMNHSPHLCAGMYARSIEAFYDRENASIKKLVGSLAKLRDLPDDGENITALAISISKSMPLKCPARQILVDVSTLVKTDLKTGIERVTRSILKELLLNPPAGYRVEPVYATQPNSGYFYAREFTMNFLQCPTSDLEDQPIYYREGDVFLGLELSQSIVNSQVEFLGAIRNHGVRIFFIIYDLLPIQIPEMFPIGADDMHKMWVNSIHGISDGVVCISKSVADSLIEWLEKNSCKRLRPLDIAWFHIGADIESSIPTYGFPENASHILIQLSKRKSFLMVGTIEPRKGHLQTIATFQKLWSEGVDVNLVIVGKEGWKNVPFEMRRTIPKTVNILRNNPELGKRLFWLDGISDEYLDKVYETCVCLIAASEGEGFGLPLIEAAQHKLPIIARDIPVFREIADEHAFYFDGKDPSDLKAAIMEWLELYKSGKHPKSENMPWLTWKQSTQQLLDVILHDNQRTDRMLQNKIPHN